MPKLSNYLSYLPIGASICLAATGWAYLLIIIPVLLYFPSTFISKNVFETDYLTQENIKRVYILSVLVSACSYIYYAGATCADSKAKLYNIPLYQHVGLTITWIAMSLSSALNKQQDMFVIATNIVAGTGWILASGFATTVNELEFEPNTKWLWIPALHYVIFNTGARSALKLSKVD